MLIVLTIVLFLVSVFAHEYGHLRPMLKSGVEVTKFAIGIPVRFLSLRFQHPKLLGGVPVFLSPLLLMGFVQTRSVEELERLTPEEQLDIYGGGIVMNLLFSCLMFFLIAKTPLGVLGIVVVGLLVLRLQKFICRYVLPVCAVLMALYVPTMLMIIIKSIPEAGSGSSAGLTSMFSVVQTVPDAFMLAGALSLILAGLNLIPLGPFDGGRLVLVYVRKWFRPRVAAYYESVTAIVALFILVLGSFDSILAILRLAWKGISH